MVNRARNMRDTITYWAPTGAKNAFGKPTWSAPVTYLARWEDVQQEVQSKHGNEITSKSRILLTQTLHNDGWLYLGTSATADPTTVSGAGEIQALGRMNDLRSATSLTVAYI